MGGMRKMDKEFFEALEELSIEKGIKGRTQFKDF